MGFGAEGVMREALRMRKEDSQQLRAIGASRLGAQRTREYLLPEIARIQCSQILFI